MPSTSDLLAMAIPQKSQTKNVKDELHAIVEEELLQPSIQQPDYTPSTPAPISMGPPSRPQMVTRSERRPARPNVANGAIIN